MGDGLGGKGFASALGTHKQDAPGQGQSIAAGFLTEGTMPLGEPMLQPFETADIGWAGFGRAVLQELAAGDGEPFFFQNLRQILRAQAAPPCQSPGRQLPHPLFTEAMASSSELLQHGRIQRFATGASNVAQQSANLIGIRQGQINSGDDVLQFRGDLPIGGGDDEGVGGPGQFGGQIAQSPADTGIVAEAMEIL